MPQIRGKICETKELTVASYMLVYSHMLEKNIKVEMNPLTLAFLSMKSSLKL